MTARADGVAFDEAELMRHIADLSHVIEHGMQTYPGLPEPVIADHLTFEESAGHYAPGTSSTSAHRHGGQHRHLPRRARAPLSPHRLGPSALSRSGLSPPGTAADQMVKASWSFPWTTPPARPPRGGHTAEMTAPSGDCATSSIVHDPGMPKRSIPTPDSGTSTASDIPVQELVQSARAARLTSRNVSPKPSGRVPKTATATNEGVEAQVSDVGLSRGSRRRMWAGCESVPDRRPRAADARRRP
jgi:hypothetical protein